VPSSIIARECDVTERTVRRWAAGAKRPQSQAIRALVRFGISQSAWGVAKVENVATAFRTDSD
jgi:hypothetical protein